MTAVVEVLSVHEVVLAHLPARGPHLADGTPLLGGHGLGAHHSEGGGAAPEGVQLAVELGARGRCALLVGEGGLPAVHVDVGVAVVGGQVAVGGGAGRNRAARDLGGGRGFGLAGLIGCRCFRLGRRLLGWLFLPINSGGALFSSFGKLVRGSCLCSRGLLGGRCGGRATAKEAGEGDRDCQGAEPAAQMIRIKHGVSFLLSKCCAKMAKSPSSVQSQRSNIRLFWHLWPR